MTNKIWDDVEAYQKKYEEIVNQKREAQKARAIELKQQSLELPEVKQFIKENLNLFLSKAPQHNFVIPEELASKFLALSDEAKDGFLNFLYDYKPEADPNTAYYEGQAYYDAVNSWENAKSKKNNLLVGLAKLRNN